MEPRDLAIAQARGRIAVGLAFVLALGAGSAALAAWLARALDSDGEPLTGTTPEAAVTGHPYS
jgi:tRNA A58 N-methylase Trm61